MRKSITDYARLIQQLRDVLENGCKKVGKRTKKAISKLFPNRQLVMEDKTAFDGLKTQFRTATKLADRKQNQTLSLFTDACDTHWSKILTEFYQEDRKLTLGEQRHEPIEFFSGAFSCISFNWSIAEKEGFAKVDSTARLDYITSASSTTIFTDHANPV